MTTFLCYLIPRREPPGPTWNTGNNFMRKGIVGDWANYFDEKTNKEYDQWIMDKIRGSGMEDLEVFKQILPNLD